MGHRQMSSRFSTLLAAAKRTHDIDQILWLGAVNITPLLPSFYDSQFCLHSDGDHESLIRDPHFLVVLMNELERVAATANLFLVPVE